MTIALLLDAYFEIIRNLLADSGAIIQQREEYSGAERLRHVILCTEAR